MTVKYLAIHRDIGLRFLQPHGPTLVVQRSNDSQPVQSRMSHVFDFKNVMISDAANAFAQFDSAVFDDKVIEAFFVAVTGVKIHNDFP